MKYYNKDRILSLEDILTIIKEKNVRVLALDGRASSGKTTLSREIVKRVKGSAVIHLDDFFLSEKERSDESGGNIDKRRFNEEVVEKILNNEDIIYRKYSCRTGMFEDEIKIGYDYSLLIVEGAYSLNPYYEKYYDLSIFLTVDKDEQKRRIELYRKDRAESFFSLWIPREELYFNKFNTEKNVDLLLETR